MTNHQHAKSKFFKPALKMAVLSVVLALFILAPVVAVHNAFAAASDLDPAGELNVGNAIKTQDAATKGAVKSSSWQNFKDNLKKFTWDKVLEELRKAGALAWKAALKNFLNTLAYDMATYLATGDKGQLPMFQTQGWGGYLQNVADNAAGTFIETLGRNDLMKFNLCSPNLDIMLRINLGLLRSYRPKAPACTFSQMTKNWDTALRDKDFLPKFQDMFNPWSNDLGIALTVQTGIETEISKAVNSATQDRIEGQGFKPVTDVISGAIKTPGSLVRDMTADTAGAAKQSAFAYTGSVVADSIDIFINTLAGKLIENWLRKGLVSKFPSLTSKLDSLTNPNAQNQNEGAAGAKDRMKTIVEPNFKVRADYDILAELVVCQDPNKAGPTDCVIDEKFRQAIEKKLTVGEALKQGYLNGNGIFGFTSDGLEPKFNEGYPYRSMLILRKYRIIPVGWEVAAQMIKDRQGLAAAGKVDGTKNLSDLVECFSGTNQPSWCAGLVDPDWVLKAPQNFCKKEGVGSEIISEQVTGAGADSALAVLRDDAYCADEQSCIKEKADGSCRAYGYCTAEKRKWDFNAKSCEPLYNTCQTFSSSAGQTNSYLKNTLDFTDCNIGNAGCLGYCQDYNFDLGKFTCTNTTGDKIYLDKQADSCEAESEGCHELIRVTPAQGETYDSIITDGVTKAYDRFKPTGLIYEKIAPSYLDCAGANPPVECKNFARYCSATEAGCELYTGVANQAEIPAKVAPGDYCPAECIGYNSFVQSETTFDDRRDAYFIPRTAKTCSAGAAGCDQFTNLDEVAKGGEGIEYYTYLRQCIKPSAQEGVCGEFYNWEGSDESGFQLKVENLKVGSNGHPAITDNSEQCEYGLLPGQDGYEANKDCREFYSRDGQVSYYIYSKTIACSDDCHPYRRTEQKAGESIYMAIPGQGVTCSAAQNGCREYTGNTGNNVRKIFTDDFSAGTIGAWTGGVKPSSESITLDADNKGHSIEVTTAALRPVGNSVSQGLDYIINFVARAKTGTPTLTIELDNGASVIAFATKPVLTTAWQIFEINLTGLNHEVSAGETLKLTVDGSFYVDNITLTEITDRYYLIKNSWQTPDACDEDLDGQYRPQYMLGCAQYKDRADKLHNLKQFNQLCSESSVGCELMIDTRNSTATTTATFTKSGTTETVPADGFIYAVYDAEKLCGADQKGCERLGQPYKYETTTLYGDVYLKNNPDQYEQILCGADAVGCDVFTYNNGSGSSGEKYFKDPGDQVCEYRQQKSGAGQSYGWYKKKVKRCGGDSGTVCLSNADCSSPATCQLETGDKACTTSDSKTLGLGGSGGIISQPSEDANGNWVGLCAAADSGCTEYLDPVSKFNTNLIFNGSFADLDNKPGTVDDGWGVNRTQNISLEPNTVYRLGRVANAGTLKIDCTEGTIHKIMANNSLADQAASFTLNSGAANSQIFYYRAAAAGTCTVTAGNSNGAVELKKVVIDYQLVQNLDSKTCNGIVNSGQGCVLFNERSQNDAGLSALTFDADAAVSGPPAGAANSADNDSNLILKVAPDRVCDQWLACKSYIKDAKGDNVCFDIGLCDAVNANGDCESFVPSLKTNQTVDGLGAAGISNLSGYSKIGLQNEPSALASVLRTDYYPFGAMEQAGEVANLSNGGFEYYGSNLYPIGWTWGNQANASWNTNIFSVINNPIAAQTEGIGYAPEGAAFLKLGSSYTAESELIDVIPNTDYTITAYLNTKNLKSGEARIDILNIANGGGVITQGLGNDWQFQMGKFKTGANVSQIKVKLYAGLVGGGALAASEGNFYYDDIKIRPTLESKCLEADGDCKTTPYSAWYTPQSCRLYPQSDSLSCDYYEDSGIRQKGWPGYCLEYDRRPGDPNTCLLWYPIDKVKGDGIEEGAGYTGKTPVYYCTETEDMKAYATVTLADGNANGIDHPGFITAAFRAYSQVDQAEIDAVIVDGLGAEFNLSNRLGSSDCGGEHWLPQVSQDGKDWINIYSTPKDGIVNGCTGGDIDLANLGLKWVKYVKGTNLKGAGPDIWSVNQLVRLNPGHNPVYMGTYCTKFVQTVTALGQNKYWASRTYQGSAHDFSCNSNVSDYALFVTSPEGTKVVPAVESVCKYNSDDAPFGAAVPSSINPYDWDSKAAAGIQPLFLEPVGQARMGQLHTSNNVKNIFAQSYGTWKWDTASTIRYVCSNTAGHATPTICEMSKNDCPGGDCVAVHKDVCSNDDSISCKTCSQGVSCLIAPPTEYKCGGQAAGDKCCAGTFKTGVTSCGGASCSLASDGYNRCGGLLTGSVCCQGGTACFVCDDNNKTVITGVSSANCGGAVACSLAPSDYYTCGGVASLSERCCPGAGNTCGSDVMECTSGSVNSGASCIDHQCNGSQCISQTTTTGGVDRYIVDSSAPGWGPPETICSASSRQPGDYCAIPPVIDNDTNAANGNNIKVNGSLNGNVTLTKNGFINLTFNTKADSQQLPLVMYGVDWGDNSKTVVTGVEMRDKPNQDQPENLYHLYSYWDLRAKANSGIIPANSCTIVGGIGQCSIKPKVQIKDNWGWCSGGTTINGCSVWQNFAGVVVVKEK